MKLRTYTKEFGTNLRLAYPVIVGMLGHTVVQLIDNIMVGQLGTAELAAVSLGNSFVFVAMSLGIGFSTAITPMIAEKAHQALPLIDISHFPKRVPRIYRRGRSNILGIVKIIKENLISTRIL